MKHFFDKNNFLNFLRTNDAECGYHSANATLDDMTYDIARVLFQEYPILVHEYIHMITAHYSKTWSLSPLLVSVGCTSDAVMALRETRTQCVMQLLDFMAPNDGAPRLLIVSSFCDFVTIRMSSPYIL